MNCEKVSHRLEEFVKAQLENFNGYILGLSGGIDSTLCLLIILNALDKDMIHCLMMPYWENDNLADSLELANNLDVQYKIISIKPMYESFYNTGIFQTSVSQENLMSRCRMCCLYGYANSLKFKVVGTCNLSEISVGYFTKYGDGGSDFEIIGDLYKHQVYELAHYYNDVFYKKLGFFPVPEKIFTKKPTADLTIGHNDEDDIGSYDILDNVLKKINKCILNLYHCGYAPITPDEIRISKLIINSEHKRRMPPIMPMQKFINKL